MTLCARGQWEPWTQVLLSRQRAGKDGDLCGLVKEVLVSDGGFVRTAGLHGDMKPPFGARAQERHVGVVRGGSAGGLGLIKRGAVGQRGSRRERDSDRMSGGLSVGRGIHWGRELSGGGRWGSGRWC